jgi:hypothetical protein
MEEIEPAQGDDGREGDTGRLLQLSLKAPHSPEAAEDGLADDAAEAVGAFAFGVRKMVEAPAVLVASWKMLQQGPDGGDAQFF